MTFVLTKALSQLLYPIFSSLMAIGIGIVLRRFRRKLGIGLSLLGLAYLYLCSTLYFGDWLAKQLEAGYEPVVLESFANADAVVVLGGGVRHSGKTLELNDSADRLLQGARLIKANKAPVIIVTEGAGYGERPSSAAMSEFLQDLCIPLEKIIEEREANNTFEHTVYLEPILAEREIQSVILVTSSWHMRRSLAVFESNLSGVEIIPYGTDSLRGKTHSIVDLLPTSGGLYKSSKAIKEYLGYLIYDIRGWID